MVSDSSGGFFKTLEVVGIIVGALVAAFGFVRFVFFQASIEEIILCVIVALSIFIVVVVIFIRRKTIDIKQPAGEKGDAPGSEALVFSLPIYSRAVRPSITPEFREKLNKNRQSEITEIKQHLIGGKRCLIITGVKGVGKSTLAAYFTEGDDFWLDFVGKTIDLKTLLIILAQWAGEKEFEGYLQQNAKVGENEINHLCEKLSGFNRKLFFDNLETLLDKNTRQFRDNGVSLFFRKLLTTDHPCRVVITSRIMPVLDEGIEMEHAGSVAKLVLKGLKEEEGAEILKGYEIEYESEDQLREISREVEGTPLLLNALLPLVKKSSAGETITDLEQWRQKYRGEILEAVLMEEAPKAGRELIFRMSVVPDPLTIAQLRVLFEKGKTDDVADDLVGRSLLVWDREQKLYELHPAVRETAIGCFEKKTKALRSSRRSALKMYMDAARGLKPREEWRSVGDCFPLVRSVELMLDIGEFEKAAHLIVDILNEPLFRWGQWHLLARLYEGLIDLWDKMKRRPKGLMRVYAGILNNYGILIRSLGEVQKSIGLHENQLDICMKIGDRGGEGAAYGNLGIAYKSLGEYRKAIEYHQKALEIAKEIGDRRGQGAAYGNLGNAYDSLGEYDKAIEYHEKCLEIVLEIGDRGGESNAYGNLGNAYWSLGEYRKAIEYQEKWLGIAKEIGDRHGEGNAYGNLGIAYDSLGEYRTAIEYHEKDLKVAEEIGDRGGEGAAYGNLGNAYDSLGEYDKAIEYHEKHLKVAEEIGDRRGEGNAYGNLGNARSKIGEHEKALEYYRKALLIQEEIDDALGIAISFGNIAKEELHFGRNAEAASNAVQGLLIAVAIHVPEAGWLASLTRECRGRLGEEEFWRVVVEAVGEEKAEEVERILAESEKREG